MKGDEIVENERRGLSYRVGGIDVTRYMVSIGEDGGEVSQIIQNFLA